MNRISQVIKYGWLHAGKIAERSKCNRIALFLDILNCYHKYKMWSNQYMKEEFHTLDKRQREEVGLRYREIGIKRDNWQTDFIKNRRFLIKYSSKKYELAHLRSKRRIAYTKQFNAGEGLQVEYDVNISRQHYLDGKIEIGKNVLLAKHVFIDYSGYVVIKDNVTVTNGVIIETHRHLNHSNYKLSHDLIEPTTIIIEEGAVIGSRAIIMPTCHYIGRHARIGAGAVVTKDVPDYAIAVGVPAIIKRIQ